jgi:hypothetical protein
MMNPTRARQTSYVGCFGFNDSPAELGEPAGFWQFESHAKMWSAFEISENLNKTFDALGEPTYSAILMATDGDGYILFHLLILSTKFISIARENEAIDLAKQWLVGQGIDWNLPESEWQEKANTNAFDLPF